MGFLMSLAIDGATVEGLMLRGGCYEHILGGAITLQLEVALGGQRTRVPVARIDWRPANPGHKNPRTGPAPHAGRFIGSSHFHPFELNWVEQESWMRAGNLPFAVEISPDPETFREILDFAGSALRIKDMDQIGAPKWPARLV